MIIFNAGLQGRDILSHGNPLLPVWPRSGHLRCLYPAHRDLFRFLEETGQPLTGDWELCASARWSCPPHSGGQQVAPDIRGGGIMFWAGRADEKGLHAHHLCEVPWEMIFSGRDLPSKPTTQFVGAEKMKRAIIVAMYKKFGTMSQNTHPKAEQRQLILDLQRCIPLLRQSWV